MCIQCAECKQLCIIRLLGHSNGMAITLIFISGRGSVISSAQERKIGFYLFGKKMISCLSCANVCAFHENPDRIYTEPTFINP